MTLLLKDPYNNIDMTILLKETFSNPTFSHGTNLINKLDLDGPSLESARLQNEPIREG